MGKSYGTKVAGAMAAGYYSILSMTIIAWVFLGRVGLGDWNNYRAIYDLDGGYLAQQGRDPLFVWLNGQAFHIFRGDGYEIFRLVLFAVFASVAVVAAFCGVLNGSGVATSVIIVLDAFLLKSLVQTREGVAFVVALVPLMFLICGRKGNVLMAATGAAIAILIHLGTFIFLITWVLALGLWIVPGRVLRSRSFSGCVTLISTLAGIITGFLIRYNAQTFEGVLGDIGVTASQPVTINFLKFVYWILVGVAVAVIRLQLVSDNRPHKLEYTYGQTLAAGMLPFAYAVCTEIIFTKVEYAAVAAIAIRILLGVIELSLLIVLLRGRANALTGLVGIGLFVDQVRLLLIS